MRIDAEPGSPSELSPGWVEQQDAVSGRVYWLHLPTDRISYRRPRRPLPLEPLHRNLGRAGETTSTTVDGPGSPRNADAAASGSAGHRPRPDAGTSLPGISRALRTTRPLAMQTRVDSSSSMSSTGSGVRSPPPPYESMPTATGNVLPPPLVPLLVSSASSPRLEDAHTSPRTAISFTNPSGGSASRQLPDIAATWPTPQPRITVATQTSPAMRSPLSNSRSRPPVTMPSPRNSLGLASSPAHAALRPPAPNLSLATTPSLSHDNTPRWNTSPVPRLPPLPPVPTQLRAESRMNLPTRSASAQFPSAMQNEAMHRPVRSSSETVQSLSTLHPIEGSSFDLNNPFLSGPATMDGPVRGRNPNSAGHSASPTPLSPSARSDRSINSGTTVAIDSDSDADGSAGRTSTGHHDERRQLSSDTWPDTLPQHTNQITPIPRNQEVTRSSPTSVPAASLERERRPYAAVLPTPALSLTPRQGRTRPGARASDRGDWRNRTSFPSPSNTTRTGLTPDIEELSSFSNSPRQPATVAGRSSTFPRSTVMHNILGPDAADSFRGSYTPNDKAATEQAIQNAMPNPEIRSRSTHQTGTPTYVELEAAENYARDLEARLSSTSSREQSLLNEIWGIKLEKAKGR